MLYGPAYDGLTVHGCTSADLIISHPSQAFATYRHTADPICSDPLHAPITKPRRALQSKGNASCDNMPCTCDSLPCNNWIDTAGWMLDPFDQGPYIGGFSTVMSVPKTPANADKGQTLFYFNGAENTDGTPRHGSPPPSGRAILQVRRCNPVGRPSSIVLRMASYRAQ